MKLLLINNDSDSWDELQSLCARVTDDVTAIHHSDIRAHATDDFDLIVLSGGWWYDDPKELLTQYADELQLIQSTTTPMLGICVGMQLMHVALDQSVPLLAEPQNGFKQITIEPAGQALFHWPETRTVFKNHTRGIIETDPEFEQLAYSPGHTEIIRHRTRPLIGVQFHPEAEPTLEQSHELFMQLVTPFVGRAGDGE